MNDLMQMPLIPVDGSVEALGPTDAVPQPSVSARSRSRRSGNAARAPRANKAAQLHRGIEAVYADAGDRAVSNDEVLFGLVQRGCLTGADLTRKEPVGRAGAMHNLVRRSVRWWQQSAKAAGWLERGDGPGSWRLTGDGRKRLTRPAAGKVLLGVSTDLGIALWASAADVFNEGFTDQVALLLTSPPYAISKERAYGGVRPQDYTDFILRLIEPIVKRLKPGGHVVLNLSQDVHLPGNAGRSTYLERLVVAMEDQLGLTLMDRLIWENKSKPPGPLQWACKSRQQLVATWEPVLWFSNDPVLATSDNRRVLMPHSDRHLKLIAQGGEHRRTNSGDGAHRIREGSFSGLTVGRIPRNIMSIGHKCARQSLYKDAARRLGLPVHGAPMPARLARFLIEFLTEEGELVVDPCAGTLTIAEQAELLGRRHISTELVGEYLLPAAVRFGGRPGVRVGTELVQAMVDRLTGPRSRVGT